MAATSNDGVVLSQIINDLINSGCYNRPYQDFNNCTNNLDKDKSMSEFEKLKESLTRNNLCSTVDFKFANAVNTLNSITSTEKTMSPSVAINNLSLIDESYTVNMPILDDISIFEINERQMYDSTASAKSQVNGSVLAQKTTGSTGGRSPLTGGECAVCGDSATGMYFEIGRAHV